MRLEELDFPYPESLIATERAPKSRVLLARGSRAPEELSGGIDDVVALLAPNDLLVINDTKVLRRRLFSEAGLEILFLAPVDASRRRWQVLCPSSRWKEGALQALPDGVTLSIVQRGRTQVVESSAALAENYFEKHGDMPLPPYIQKARAERRNRAADGAQYQTAWAEREGSLAAPTASLHFKPHHLDKLRERGTRVATITLHVGLGTFLPITAPTLDEHVMHAESVAIPGEAWRRIEETKRSGGRVFALGTTVTRSLESAALGRLPAATAGGFEGATDLFIRPGFEFKAVDVLMTNFHQPRSTLLALVAAFAGLENVQRAYRYAIEREFRLFSYGDLSIWMRA